MVKYTCKRCKKEFDQKIVYVRHINRKKKCSVNNSGSKINKKSNTHYCKTCDKLYSRKDALTQHKKSKLHESNLKKIKINSKNNKNTSKTAGNNNNTNTLNNSNNNSVTNNNNNITNNYYISSFGNEQIDKLTTQDKIAILSSDENPMVTIIVKTNLNPAIPEYHNVGYIDLKSGFGYIFNGETWEKKEIRVAMNDLLNFKGRDLRKNHKEVSKYMTNEDNKNVSNALLDIDNIIAPRHEQQIRSKRNLVTNLKTHFYNKRNLIINAIEKSEKPILELEIKNKTKNILKDGMTIEELDKILADNRIKAEKLAPKKEIINYVITLIKKGLTDEQHKKMYQVIEDITEENEVNIIMRLLCETYYYGNNIDADTLKQKIKDDMYANKLISE